MDMYDIYKEEFFDYISGEDMYYEADNSKDIEELYKECCAKVKEVMKKIKELERWTNRLEAFVSKNKETLPIAEREAMLSQCRANKKCVRDANREYKGYVKKMEQSYKDSNIKALKKVRMEMNISLKLLDRAIAITADYIA